MIQIISNLLVVILVLTLAILAFGLPIMVLWNWLMPTIFGLPEITFWQSCGLQILLSLLIIPNTFKTEN